MCGGRLTKCQLLEEMSVPTKAPRISHFISQYQNANNHRNTACRDRAEQKARERKRKAFSFFARFVLGNDAVGFLHDVAALDVARQIAL